MNVHDSEQLASMMIDAGFEQTEDINQAQVILVNTCSIREKVALKIVSQIGRYRQLKENNPDLVIGVGGCLAQHWGQSLLRKNVGIDLVFGTHALDRAPAMIRRIQRKGGAIVDTSFREDIPSMSICPRPDNANLQAFVTIMQGCDNFCSYCVVPHLRGREKSRPSQNIIDEIRALVAHGVKEVTLLGQNVNSYGKGLVEGLCFSDLITKIDAIDGLERIRFTTSHPKDLTEDLINCFGKLGKLCEYIHLPFQTGSNSVLGRMNRGYTREDYYTKVESLRETCPGIAISSDAMVGFPGETTTDFEATMELIDKIRFDNLFSFKYSEREGTTAVNLDDKVPEKEKSRRLSLLQELQDCHTLEMNKAMVGKAIDVLVEGISKNSSRDMMGRTRTNKVVNFRSKENLHGKTVNIHITAGYLHSLRGELS
ncbi:MAG TPA: tRNA (N6-isopentenyl adenosine(37)-C2)-methylthiotransferase MiaB [Syntrophus sp. (in: bacteria)]|jgi:tRNA-2-methylthio-N6-dimethylallyladenosine synthase|nr:tRNA (N6-isopentenyl adenosine(37)-C2)-methylthiotransferase MiaB [Syntrophus sp. (in: bacteria)]